MNNEEHQIRRADALDALRGTAIIGMILSGQLPFHQNVLPAWMYHAQVPPPLHKFIPTLPGITWVDLVFPFFLFAMGAAFPLAMAKKIERGEPWWKMSLSIAGRGILLGFFALYVQAIRPYQLSSHPDTMTWVVSIGAFLFLFAMYGRLPEEWHRTLRWGIKGAGWTCAVLFFVLTVYPDGSGFRLTRSDIIIVVLANMALFGSFAWLITRGNLLLRLGIMAILIAIRLSNKPLPIDGWVRDVYMWTPIPWMYTMYYQQYLLIVLPGTIAGEMILRWINKASTSATSTAPAWSRRRYFTIAVMMVMITLVLLAGLYSRMVTETVAATAVLCFAGWRLMHSPGNATEELYRQIFSWSVFWITLGLFFEPFEGGIKKDHATISYYFVTSGLAGCSIIFFSVVIDVFRRKRAVQLLIDNGQNPMIAYSGINNFIIPLLGVTGILSVMNAVTFTPFLGFVKGLVITLLLMLFTGWCTKRRIFWRT